MRPSPPSAPPQPPNRNPREVQKTLALLVLAVGVALLAYMVAVEGEPGLLPLLLVAAGAAWYGVTRWRTRA